MSTKKDTVTQALGGVCLMGGGSTTKEAMECFVRQANGCDVNRFVLGELAY